MKSSAKTTEKIDKSIETEDKIESEVDDWAMLRDVILPHRMQMPVSK